MADLPFNNYLEKWRHYVPSVTQECSTRLCFPRGGYGQHVRWMILLSENYFDKDSLNCPGFFFPKLYYPVKTVDRLKFILEYIYAEDRSYHNWTDRERYLGNRLAPYMPFTHDYSLFPQNSNYQYKTLLGITDVDSACRHWYKLHPFWLGSVNLRSNKEEFVAKTIEYNQANLAHVPLSNEKVLYVESEKLNKPTLDKEFYDRIVDFLSIENVYEAASQIHERWYNLHHQAEKQVVEYFKTSVFPDIPWEQYKEPFKIMKFYNEQDYENIRNTIMEMYDTQA